MTLPRRKFQFRQRLRLLGRAAAQAIPDLVGGSFVQGTGMGLLVVDAQLGQKVQDLVGLDFQFPC
jgi:hypothetical protein